MDTKQTILAWLADTRFDDRKRQPGFAYSKADDKPAYSVVRHPLILNSGDTISLQYSNTHYCAGTDTVPTSMELWNCPDSPILGPHDPSDPYAYVELDTIVEYIDSLGGIVSLNTQLAMLVVSK